MPTSVAQVVGSNARKLRLDAGVTLDQFAQAARFCGLSAWTTGRVGDFEAGRVAPSLPTLYAVALALHQATGQPVTLADLLATAGAAGGDEPVQINDELTVDASALRAAMTGQPVTGFTDRTRRADDVADKGLHVGVTLTDEWKRLPKLVRRNLDPLTWLQVASTMRESDVRMCRSIGVDRDLGAALMVKLWNCSFCDERDLRAGPDANAQRRGQVSRQLKAELMQEMGKR